jgi:DNA-binding MarR family transcriptional regulator
VSDTTSTRGDLATETPTLSQAQELMVLRQRLRSASARALGEELALIPDTGTATPHQLAVLVRIPDEGWPMGQLAHALGIMPASATLLVDRLVNHGLVERRRAPDDRRVVRVFLSERGKRLASVFYEADLRVSARLLSSLPAAEAGQFLSLLATCVEGLEASLPDDLRPAPGVDATEPTAPSPEPLQARSRQ